MRCPTLAELPPPPPDKTGWPWTEETPSLPETMPDGSPWPRISIVTPSYNQGQFIEETIRSILLQGYPNLEYIIMDGGSTDNSVEIIKKYEPWLAYWVSEKDRGQSHAINKGWGHATGQIFAWLNSDDMYVTNALALVSRHFLDNIECQMLVGGAGFIENDCHVEQTKQFSSISFDHLLYQWRALPQPSCFWLNELGKRVGLIDEILIYSMDREYFLRLLVTGVWPQFLPDILSIERLHDQQKARDRKALFTEYATVVDFYFQKHMGGRWLNLGKLFWFWRRRICVERGFLRAIRSFPSSQEYFYFRHLTKKVSIHLKNSLLTIYPWKG